jgi:hypothetical protein
MDAYQQKQWEAINAVVEAGGGVMELLKDPIKVEVLDTPQAIFKAGASTKEAHGKTWIIPQRDLPEYLERELLARGQKRHDYYFIAVREPIGGQAGGGGNIQFICNPYAHDDGVFFRVTVGCRHTMEGTQLGNCYWSYKCTKCDYHYKVDSGD